MFLVRCSVSALLRKPMLSLTEALRAQECFLDSELRDLCGSVREQKKFDWICSWCGVAGNYRIGPVVRVLLRVVPFDGTHPRSVDCRTRNPKPATKLFQRL